MQNSKAKKNKNNKQENPTDPLAEDFVSKALNCLAQIAWPLSPQKKKQGAL